MASTARGGRLEGKKAIITGAAGYLCFFYLMHT